jgi:peptide/nickel transport system ATP-binding protein
MTTPALPLLALDNVSKIFARPAGLSARIASLFSTEKNPGVHAVDAVTLTIAAGEVVGLVGESGCGKSTVGRIAVGLQQPSSGSVLWKGEPVELLNAQQKRQKQLATQLIFQDPYASLNPRMRVVDIVGEAPVVHGIVAARDRETYAADLMRQVGLSADMLRRFPHQFSGGQRARIGIARALAVRPQFLVCDEAVAALDVSIQAQVLNLFLRLRTELNLTYLFISHNLGVVRHVSDRVAVMYLGRVVEMAPVDALFETPNHPYTVTLLASVPTLEVRKKRYEQNAGDVPSPLQPPVGCHFHPRCPHAMSRCQIEAPALREVAPLHFSACHLNDMGR